MADTIPTKHGEEGTHWACDQRLKKDGGKSLCCDCAPHDGCGLADTTPQSVDEVILELQQKSVTWAQTGVGKNYDMVHYGIEARQNLYHLIASKMPQRRELIEPLTKRKVPKAGDKVAIDLDADMKGSLVFIQDNGFNTALDQVDTILKQLFGMEL